MVSRREAVGLPLLGLVGSFVIVLGLGLIATGDNADEPPPVDPGVKPAATAEATPGPGLKVKVTVPETSPSPPGVNENAEPAPPASGGSAPRTITVCVTPYEGWSLKDPAAGWQPGPRGTFCRELDAAAQDLDVGLEAKR